MAQSQYGPQSAKARRMFLAGAVVTAAVVAVPGLALYERGTLVVSAYEPGAGRKPLLDSRLPDDAVPAGELRSQLRSVQRDLEGARKELREAELRANSAEASVDNGVDLGEAEGAAPTSDQVDRNALLNGKSAGRASLNAGFQNPSSGCETASRISYPRSPLSQVVFLQGCLLGSSGG